jgi:hypothetical protein
MAIQFFDTVGVENGVDVPVVDFKDIDPSRVNDSIEGETSGYICTRCQCPVEFYKVGHDFVNWSCNCN